MDKKVAEDILTWAEQQGAPFTIENVTYQFRHISEDDLRNYIKILVEERKLCVLQYAYKLSVGDNQHFISWKRNSVATTILMRILLHKSLYG